MKQFGKKLISIVAVLTVVCQMLAGLSFADELYTDDEIKDTIDGIVSQQSNGDTLFSEDFLKNASYSSSDWYAFALARAGVDEDYSSYLSMLKSNIKSRYKFADKLDKNKATEWHRTALTVAALGGDPTDIDGINLLSDGVYMREKLDAQGINGCIWALIALNSCESQPPENSLNSKESIMNKLLDSQQNNGGFSFSDNVDVDITAMAVTALAPFRDEKEADAAITKALQMLSEVQSSDGSFNNSSESTAQVIIALCSIGIDPQTDKAFTKNRNIVEALMSFRNSDGGFAHENGGKSDAMAGEQSLCALTALLRKNSNMSGLYDLKDEKSRDIIFEQADAENLKALPSNLTGENYETVEQLYEKLNSAKNKDDFSKEFQQLEKMKSEVEQIQQNVEQINSEIADKLYPFDDISIRDKSTVDKIIARTNKLSEYDKQKISGYNDLISAKAKIKTQIRAIVIAAFLCVVLLVCVIILAAKKHKFKGKNQYNEEW
ncbi:MAG: prenyltransferase/squalene oxidase repeat-containing protein [Oscillospiraceae bacterium]